MLDERLKSFATQRQAEAMDAYNESGGSSDKAALILGVTGRSKGGISDLRKARHYLDLLIEIEAGQDSVKV